MAQALTALPVETWVVLLLALAAGLYYLYQSYCITSNARAQLDKRRKKNRFMWRVKNKFKIVWTTVCNK